MPRRGTVWDEPAQPPAVLSQEPIERVDERRQSTRTQHEPEPPGERDLGQEHDAAAAVAREGHPVAADDPPAFRTSVLRHQSQQAPGFLVRKWKQGKLLTQVDRGDDPRRPATESSTARIEQHGAGDIRNGRHG
jgi:hypothetical protein